MKITVLGSGAWEGIPAAFCQCRVCKVAVEEPTGLDNRTRPQLLIETEKGKFLLEMSPDIRLQSTRFQLPEIKDYVISHWHFDHMYGLKELHAWIKYTLKEKPTVYVSPTTKNMIDKEFAYLPLDVQVIQPFEQFSLFDIQITALPVYHMRGQDDQVEEDDIRNAYGYLLESKNKRIAYLGDYYRIPEATKKKIKDVDILIADGTYLLTEDYKKFKPNHMHGSDIFTFTKSINAQQVYFHSISHLTKKTHIELQEKLPQSHFITFDGMEIKV